MTAKELLDEYDAWICKGDKTYVAVSRKAFFDEAMKIANLHFKVKKDRLHIVSGYIRGKNMYKGIGIGKCTHVWVVEVK